MQPAGPEAPLVAGRSPVIVPAAGTKDDCEAPKVAHCRGVRWRSVPLDGAVRG